MSTIRPEITGRTVGDNLEPLAVSPRQACRLLAVGNTRLYQLIAQRELDAYQEGRARRVTVQSIRARIARLLAAAGKSEAAQAESQPRSRGRPRKTINATVTT
jgi:excisionase family DNA binding protein